MAHSAMMSPTVHPALHWDTRVAVTAYSGLYGGITLLVLPVRRLGENH